MKKAIALIVKEPDEIYLDFLQDFAQGPAGTAFAQGPAGTAFAQGPAGTAFAQGPANAFAQGPANAFAQGPAGTAFAQYDIYIIVDSDKDLTELTNKYKNLNFIQLSDQHCLNHGFQKVNYIGIKKKVSGWDKALLFFSVIIPLKYEHVWFIEDDVFFLKEQVLINLDQKYPNQDLIANCDFDKNNVNKNPTNVGWVWPLISIKIDKPWYAGMMCITRMSKYLLQGIRWYALKFDTLFFLEALFPTITSHFKLSYAQPTELETVTYRDVFFLEEDDKKRIETHVFHPMKDLNKHKELRTKI